MTLILSLSVSLAGDIDVRTPVRGSARMRGMGGAYRAVASGALNQRTNPAAIAMQPPSTDPDAWRPDGLFTVTGLTRLLEDPPWGPAPLQTFSMSGGVIVQRADHAAALTIDLRNDFDPETSRGMVLTEVTAGWGHSAMDDQLQVGVTPGVMVVRTRPVRGPSTAILPVLGSGVRFDVPRSPVRLGAGLRTGWRGSIEDEEADGVRLPWEVGVGLALRWGRLQHGLRERGDPSEPPGEQPKFVQASLDVILVGPVPRHTSVEQWTGGAPAFEDVPSTLSVAVGVEFVPLAQWLRLRAGAYTDPARGRLGREGPVVHATLGADVPLIEFPRGRWRWRLTPTVDVSPLGIVVGMGGGLW